MSTHFGRPGDGHIQERHRALEKHYGHLSLRQQVLGFLIGPKGGDFIAGPAAVFWAGVFWAFLWRSESVFEPWGWWGTPLWVLIVSASILAEVVLAARFGRWCYYRWFSRYR